MVELNEVQARAAAGEPIEDTAPGVPYADLTPEQKAARMRAARPAGWGTDEQIANQNMVSTRMLKQGPR